MIQTAEAIAPASGRDRVVMSDGDYAYAAIDWPSMPEGFVLGDVGGIGVDSRDNVYVFNRGEHPMMVFDREGHFLRSWGQKAFKRPHAVYVDPDDSVWLTDDGDHVVRKYTAEGKLLLTIGDPGKPQPVMAGRPFNRCTHTARSPQGDIYVSDGYANARVHKFSPDGKLLFSWGEPGIGPGEFAIPHNICCDSDGYVYVADRENHRVQVFDGKGKFQTEWPHLHRPCAMCMCGASTKKRFFIGEIGPGTDSGRLFPNLGPRISVVSDQGKVLARIGRDGFGDSLGQFVAPHGMAVDTRGDLYVGEVARRGWSLHMGPDKPVPPALRTIRKLIRLAPANP